MGLPMLRLAAASAACLVAAAAGAVVPVYADRGKLNTAEYTLKAAETGDIVAYFLGHTAAYTSFLRLQVNGVDTGIEGLRNQTTAPGTALSFGPVTKGDLLTFGIRVQTTRLNFWSDAAQNPDRLQHAWIAPYAGGDFGVPAGTYVGFEDLLGGGDKDYDDMQFVFTNVASIDPSTAVPEPATWAMLLTGFGLVGLGARRRSRPAPAA